LVTVEAKRGIVASSSVILFILSIVSLASGGSTAHTVLNALVLIASVFGFVGALRRDPGHLFLFEIVTMLLFLYGIAVIIVHLAQNVKVSRFAWDIAVTVLLAVVAAFTHDMRKSSEVV